jgi:hypothetical protein
MTGEKESSGDRNSRKYEESGTNLRKTRLSARIWESSTTNDNEPRTIKPQQKLHSALCRQTAACTFHGNRVSD